MLNAGQPCRCTVQVPSTGRNRWCRKACLARCSASTPRPEWRVHMPAGLVHVRGSSDDLTWVSRPRLRWLLAHKNAASLQAYPCMCTRQLRACRKFNPIAQTLWIRAQIVLYMIHMRFPPVGIPSGCNTATVGNICRCNTQTSGSPRQQTGGELIQDEMAGCARDCHSCTIDVETPLRPRQDGDKMQTSSALARTDPCSPRISMSTWMDVPACAQSCVSRAYRQLQVLIRPGYANNSMCVHL